MIRHFCDRCEEKVREENGGKVGISADFSLRPFERPQAALTCRAKVDIAFGYNYGAERGNADLCFRCQIVLVLEALRRENSGFLDEFLIVEAQRLRTEQEELA